MKPESSKEDQLEINALESLDAIPIESMRKYVTEISLYLSKFSSKIQNTRFANRSRRFMDAYARGLNGRQAAWAAKKYKGHRVLPESLMCDLDAANVL